jgi:hypothetical protein
MPGPTGGSSSRDNHADLHSSGATVSSFSHNSSIAALLSLHNSRGGGVARPPQQATLVGYPCYNCEKVGHFTKECHLPRQANSHHTLAPTVN